ncbi:MAG: DUF2723 domain-containing protein [Acidobacteriota bacterium]|nr:DUF2723 domain-containing protein [Acidobacteriota bacterium]
MTLGPGGGRVNAGPAAPPVALTPPRPRPYLPAMAAAGRPALQASLLAGAVFAVYAAGACRTIYVGDSGELVAAAATLGIPHPSGYPLYVLLGWLWIAVVPLGSVALRMSLFSAFFGALACGLFYGSARRQGLPATAALMGASCLAFAPSFWSQATVQRVYTLNGFFVVAVTACALEWHRTRRPGWLVLAAFAAGLGASNHTVMGVVGIAVGLFAVISEPQLLRRPRRLAACVGAGLAGLLPYLYMPWRSRQDPRLDWADPETLGALLGAMTRRDYWDRAWIESAADLPAILGDFLRGLGAELLWAGVLVAGLGVVAARRHGRPLLLPGLVMAANFLAVAFHGSRTDLFVWHRYYIPAWVMAALLTAWGTEPLVARWGRRAIAALAVPLALLVLGWPRFDRSDFEIADDFSRKLLATLPPGAHLAAADDNVLFVLIYLHLVEGLRPDVDLILQGVGGAELEALRFDPDDDPLYFTHHPNWRFPGLEVVPVGLVFRTVRAGAARPGPVLPAGELAGAWDPAVPKDYLARNLVGHYHYMLGVTHERTDWPRARAEFERAAAAAPDNDVLFYNLGLIYRRNGMLRRALAAFERSAAINPRAIAADRPARATDRIAELRPEVARLAALEAAVRRDGGLEDRGTGTAVGHRAMAAALAARGAAQAAYGHELLAQELAAP